MRTDLQRYGQGDRDPEARAAWAAYKRSRYVPRERELEPCGTQAAYRRHLKAGEPPCAACRGAEAMVRRKRRQARARRSSSLGGE